MPSLAHPPPTPSLFDAEFIVSHSRTGGPPTSEEAAESILPALDGQIAAVTRIVAEAGTRGRICAEVTARLGRDRGCVARRLRDAQDRKLVRVDGDTRTAKSGRAQQVYRITDSGLRLAARATAEEASR